MKKDTRVLIVTFAFKPILGGVAEYAYQMARAFQRRGVDLMVLSRIYPGSEAYDRASSINIRRTCPGASISINPGLVITLGKIASLSSLGIEAVRKCKQWSPDIIYLPSMYPFANFLSRFGSKVVITFHGGEVLRYAKASPLKSLHRKLLTRSCASSDLVLANSHFTAGRLADLGVDSSKIVVTGCGADWARFANAPDSQEAKSQLGLIGKKVILTLGYLCPRKGFDTVIRSLPELRRKHPDILYVIAGQGPMRQPLESMANELELGDCVRFTGRLADEDIGKNMAACDVFAMPNRETSDGSVEGFGIVFIEANACGKPVVAGRSGGAVDAVEDGETGFLVDPYVPAEVEHAIDELLRNPALAAKLGRQGRERAERRFKWETVAGAAVERALRLIE